MEIREGKCRSMQKLDSTFLATSTNSGRDAECNLLSGDPKPTAPASLAAFFLEQAVLLKFGRSKDLLTAADLAKQWLRFHGDKDLRGDVWCARLGSNQQPLPSEGSTLSIELRTQ